jgi:hypothetical protein
MIKDKGTKQSQPGGLRLRGLRLRLRLRARLRARLRGRDC